MENTSVLAITLEKMSESWNRAISPQHSHARNSVSTQHGTHRNAGNTTKRVEIGDRMRRWATEEMNKKEASKTTLNHIARCRSVRERRAVNTACVTCETLTQPSNTTYMIVNGDTA